MSEPRRYAIYFVPAAGTALAEKGSRWLGYDCDSGATFENPPFDGLAPPQWVKLVRTPRPYGFHATLKPPFRLARGCQPDALADMTSALAQGLTRTAIPRLTVGTLGNFLALLAEDPLPDISPIAAVCVRALDAFRAAPDAAELERRRSMELDARQTKLLQDWGYPFVLDQYRFHMTLTGRLDPQERERTAPLLRDWFAPALEAPVLMEALTLLHQPDSAAPFRVMARFPLSA